MGITLLVAQSTADQGTIRSIGVAMTVLSVALLVISVRAARLPARLRLRRDVVRLVLQTGGAAWIATASGVGVSIPVITAAGTVGAIAGWYQGRTVDVSHRGEQIYIRRSLLGMLVWAGGLLLMQLAAFVNQAGLVDVGHAMSWFSAGVTTGTVVGRAEPIAIARRSLASVSAVGVLVAAFLFVALAPPAAADHVDQLELLAAQIDCGPVLNDLGVSHERVTYEVSQDDAGLFITCLPGGAEPIIQVYEFTDGDGATAMVTGFATGHGDVQHAPPAVGGEQVAFYEFTGDAAGCALLAQVDRRVYGFVANDTDCLGGFLDEVATILSLVPLTSGDDQPADEEPSEDVAAPENGDVGVVVADDADISPDAAGDSADAEQPAGDEITAAGEPQKIEDPSSDEDTASSGGTTPPPAERNDPEDITVDEATATALTALVVILASGVISLIEFAELEQLSRSSPGAFRRAVANWVVHGRPTHDPPQDPVDILFDALEDVDDIEAPGAVDLPPLVPRSEHDPWYYPPHDQFTGESTPVAGSRVYDVDRDGTPDVIAVDDDADGLTDELLTPDDLRPRGTTGPVGEVEGALDHGPDAAHEDFVDRGAGEVVIDPIDHAAAAVPEPPPVEPAEEVPESTTVEEASDPAVAISRQEIDDIIDWGTRHGRSHEDIQKDVDGLNQARGGTASVPLGNLPERVETPRGWVTVSPTEAADYRYSKDTLHDYEMMKNAARAASRRLQDEIDYWKHFELQPEMRWAAGLNEVVRVNDEWAEQQQAIQDDIWAVSRRPGRADWDHTRFDSYDEAWEAYENRDATINTLDHQRSALDNEYRERLARMTETTEALGSQYPLGDDVNPITTGLGLGAEGQPDLSDPGVAPHDDLAGGSVFNRPSERLAQLATEQERQLREYAELDEAADRHRAVIEAFEARSVEP